MIGCSTAGDNVTVFEREEDKMTGHSFGHFDLTPLNASPERMRARGTVYWQAEFQGRPAPDVIKAVVGEDWILERAASGGLKFVLYLNTFHHLLPESAPLDL